MKRIIITAAILLMGFQADAAIILKVDGFGTSLNGPCLLKIDGELTLDPDLRKVTHFKGTIRVSGYGCTIPHGSYEVDRDFLPVYIPGNGTMPQDGEMINLADYPELEQRLGEIASEVQ